VLSVFLASLVGEADSVYIVLIIQICLQHLVQVCNFHVSINFMLKMTLGHLLVEAESCLTVLSDA